MKTRVIMLLILICMLAPQVQAERKTPSLETMNAEKWAFLTTNTPLTEQEASLVYPIFMAFEQQSLESHKKRRIKTREFKPTDETTPEEFQEMNNLLLELEQQKTTSMIEYNQKLSGVLSPKKLFFYHQAEQKFRRRLLNSHQRGEKTPK